MSKDEALSILEDIKENVNTCCAITMDPDDVLELIDKLENYINNVSRYLMWNREKLNKCVLHALRVPCMANSFVDLLKTDHIGKRRTVVFTRELGRTYYTSLSKGEPGRNKSRGDAWLAR